MNIDFQIVTDSTTLPSEKSLCQWVKLATAEQDQVELVIRIVDGQESAELNQSYRSKEGATNVLSFPFERPIGLPEEALEAEPLGDLVICAPVVEAQAIEQKKPLMSHWAHMVIHGCLHLQGYDHIDPIDATKMESLEITLLKKMGVDNPYLDELDE